MGYAEAIEQQMLAVRRLSTVTERDRQMDGLVDDFPVFRQVVQESESIYVAADICNLIFANPIGDAVLTPEAVPLQSGFIYFARPCTMKCGTGYRGDYYQSLRAIAFQLAPTGITWGYIVADHNSREDVRPSFWSAWTFGRNAYKSESGLDILLMEGKAKEFLLTLFAFMQQRVLVASSRPISNRQARKRLAAALRHDPIVQVIELRRREYQQRDESHDSDVEYTCQWLVRGHWHRYHTKEGVKLIWTKPYIKGPADKPLRTPTITAYEVRR